MPESCEANKLMGILPCWSKSHQPCPNITGNNEIMYIHKQFIILLLYSAYRDTWAMSTTRSSYPYSCCYSYTVKSITSKNKSCNNNYWKPRSVILGKVNSKLFKSYQKYPSIAMNNELIINMIIKLPSLPHSWWLPTFAPWSLNLAVQYTPLPARCLQCDASDWLV